MKVEEAARPARAKLGTSILLLLLVSLTPFVGFYAHNLGEGVRPGDLAVYAVGTFVAATSIFLVLYVAFRPTTHRLANGVATLVIVLFNYESATSVLAELGFSPFWQMMGWIYLLVGALAAVVILGTRPVFHMFLLLFAAVTLAAPAFQVIASRQVTDGAASTAEAYPLQGEDVWSGQAMRRPNIYWLVLDSYPSPAHLIERYGFDNSEFVEYLRRLGFFVASDSYANANLSVLSVASTLNMDYVLDDFEEVAGDGDQGWVATPALTVKRSLADVLAGDNRTVGFLRQLGYAYVHFDNGFFQATRCRGYEDACVRGSALGFSELEAALLTLVPYGPLSTILDLPAPRPRDANTSPSGTGIPELFDGLARAGLPADQPRFVYAHFATPHPPFLNRADCGLYAEPKLAHLHAETVDRLLIEQIRCVNRHLRDALDGLVRADPDAILIVSGDHGPRLEHIVLPGRVDDYVATDYADHLSILYALRLPADCARGAPEGGAPGSQATGSTPVNTMRIVFACLGGHDPRLIEDRFFVAGKRGDGTGWAQRVAPH